jgi:hypothetical protein
MESLHLVIPTALDALLAQRAVSEGQTKGDIVRAALEAYLAPQTPLERSLQKLERTVNDRFNHLEKLVRQDLRNHSAQRSAARVPAPVPPVLSENLSETVQAFEEEDEADEILPEFLAFASPAIQQHLDVLS